MNICSDKVASDRQLDFISWQKCCIRELWSKRSDMHEWYNKKVVYIGNPNQTRHLDAHHELERVPSNKVAHHTMGSKSEPTA